MAVILYRNCTDEALAFINRMNEIRDRVARDREKRLSKMNTMTDLTNSHSNDNLKDSFFHDS